MLGLLHDRRRDTEVEMAGDRVVKGTAAREKGRGTSCSTG